MSCTSRLYALVKILKVMERNRCLVTARCKPRPALDRKTFKQAPFASQLMLPNVFGGDFFQANAPTAFSQSWLCMRPRSRAAW